MTTRNSGAAWLVAITTLGCNALLGIDRGHLVSVDAGSGGAAGGGTGGTNGTGGGKSEPDGGSTGGAAAGGQGGLGAGGAAGGGNGGVGGTGGLRADAGLPDAGVVKPADVAGEIRCGKEICQIASGQACCVATVGGDAHCSKSCDSSTQVKFACDGAEDCASGDTCCYPFGQTTASCASSCATGGRVFCGSDKDCAPGQYCTEGANTFETVFICKDFPKAHNVFCGSEPCDTSKGNVCCYDKSSKKEQCMAKCEGTDVVPFACDGPEDCDAPSTCCATHTGLNVFTGNQCVVGCTASVAVLCRGSSSCGAGQACCLGGSNGATCSPGACGGSTTCANSADCRSPAAPECGPITATGIGQSTGVSTCR